MTLIQWWLDAPERAGPKVPLLLKAILVPWLLLGVLIALIPELQIMPAPIRFILGLPASLGILWMAVGVFLSIADKVIALATFIRRKAH